MADASRFQNRTFQLGAAIAGLGLATMSVAGIGSLRSNYRGMPVEDYIPLSPWVPPTFIAGVVILVAGILVAMIGLMRENKAPPAPSKADLRPDIESRELPFTVCAKCRIIIDLPHAFSCPQCDSMHDCVRVESDPERGFAISALGPPPA